MIGNCLGYSWENVVKWYVYKLRGIIQRASLNSITMPRFHYWICGSACQPALLLKRLSVVALAICLSDRFLQRVSMLCFVFVVHKLPKLSSDRVNIMQRCCWKSCGSSMGSAWCPKRVKVETCHRIVFHPFYGPLLEHLLKANWKRAVLLFFVSRHEL